MKALTIMTIILLASSAGCSKSTSDQNFQDHQDRQPSSSRYNPETDPNINSLSNQPASPKEGL